MPTPDHSLGGRLPLLWSADLDADQKKLYHALVDKMVGWANKSGFRADTADGRLIGPFNPMLFSPLISQATLDLTEAETAHTALSEKVRQVVILCVGAVWKADYELYARLAVGQKAGFDEATVQALAAGQRPTGLSAAEGVAYDFTHQLVAAHRVDQPLYQRAVETFGAKGVVDMVYLAGNYMTVSALLNTFAVPAPGAA